LALGSDAVYVAVADRVVVYSRYGTLLRDSPTSLDGLLGQRRALAVDRDGRVYIADGARVLRLDAEGRLDPTWSVGSRVDLRAPSALAIAPDGGLYVADADGARVVRLDPSGDLAQSWTSAGATSLVSPQTLVVSSDGRLFVADVGLRRVLELSDAGGRQPFQREELGDPLPLAMDGAGNLYVGNASTGRVSAVRPGGWFFRLPFGR
jgi:sugar lactone lactonase YvrE